LQRSDSTRNKAIISNAVKDLFVEKRDVEALSLSLSLFLSLKTERRKREKHIGTRITGRNAVEALVARR